MKKVQEIKLVNHLMNVLIFELLFGHLLFLLSIFLVITNCFKNRIVV